MGGYLLDQRSWRLGWQFGWVGHQRGGCIWRNHCWQCPRELDVCVCGPMRYSRIVSNRSISIMWTARDLVVQISEIGWVYKHLIWIKKYNKKETKRSPEWFFGVYGSRKRNLTNVSLVQYSQKIIEVVQTTFCAWVGYNYEWTVNRTVWWSSVVKSEIIGLFSTSGCIRPNGHLVFAPTNYLQENNHCFWAFCVW